MTRELTKSEKARMKEIFDQLYQDKDGNWHRLRSKGTEPGQETSQENDSEE